MRISTTNTIASLITGALLFAGCANAAGVPPTATSQPATATSTPRPSQTPLPTEVSVLKLDPGLLKGVKLSFIHPWSGTLGQAVERITTEFNNENIWGVKVEIIAAGSSGEAFNHVNASLENGKQPQIAAVPPEHIAAWSENKDLVVDLGPFINDAEWGIKPEEIKDFNPQIWNQTILEGRQTGIPAQRYLQLIIYNQTWAEELGFREIPQSPDQFRDQVCAATHANLTDKNKEKIGTGGYIVTTDPNTQMAWMSAFDLDYSQISGEKEYHFEQPAAEKSFSFLRQLFDKSCAWLSRNPLPFDYFAQRQTIAYATTMLDLPEQEAALKAAGSSDRWTVIPFPGPESKPIVLQNGLNYVLLKSNPPEELAAWLFLRWLMLPRNQIKMIEASGSLPLSQSASDGLSDYRDQHPQWASAISLLDKSKIIPVQPSWRLVKGILEDAAWQLFQPTLQPIPDILKQLDETIPEVIK
jgi:multiple sugar transport system substrate-binding protein